MIYGVTVYHKSGKLKKRITRKTLEKRHWELFYEHEKVKKKFVKEKMRAGCHKLLKQYQMLNSISDDIVFNPSKN